MYERQNLILDYNNAYNFDLLLTDEADNLDFDNFGSLSSKGLITSNLVFYYDFSQYTTVDNISSLYPYANSIPTSSTLLLHSTGSTISYLTDTYINKKYISLNGGYYTSIYQSPTGNTYNVLPSPAQEGYTLNFWVNLKSNVNEGYFYKIGDENNGYGFYFKSGRIGYKSYVNRIDSTGTTSVETRNILSGPIFTGDGTNNWINITIIFKRNQILNKCCEDCNDNLYNIVYDAFQLCTTLDEIPDNMKGMLTILVNGRPCMDVLVEEPVISTHKVTIGQDFLGGISIASMYDKPLTIPQNIRNYYAFKTIYRRTQGFGGVNNQINSNLI